ncbi:uncharacterized protein IAS62_001892 [Cryptococcus decagattii]|uniref:Uncharacterized protein n=1 Tax=Cryptococcus decagattii TaxID=1859122 RepID=A0ABZ2ARS7_9TREE
MIHNPSFSSALENLVLSFLKPVHCVDRQGRKSRENNTHCVKRGEACVFPAAHFKFGDAISSLLSSRSDITVGHSGELSRRW